MTRLNKRLLRRSAPRNDKIIEGIVSFCLSTNEYLGHRPDASGRCPQVEILTFDL